MLFLETYTQYDQAFIYLVSCQRYFKSVKHFSRNQAKLVSKVAILGIVAQLLAKPVNLAMFMNYFLKVHTKHGSKSTTGQLLHS